MSNSERILVVADQLPDMQALKTAFAGLPPGWQVHFSQNESDALCYLDQCEFEGVFADFGSGAVAGAQFLHEVWKKHPTTSRYLLVEQMDADLMVTCVLNSHQFVPKPLSTPAILTALERLQAMNRLIRVPHVQEVVAKMRTLPSRPTLYLEILRELRSQNADAHTIGEMISRDMAISSKLIQIVNSAYYGMAQEIFDPVDAVLLLGMQATASMVLSIEAFSQFDKVKPRFNLTDRIWRHSQQVAQSAKRIAELSSNDPTLANEAYTAGLLHDVGKLALALNFEEEYQAILNLTQSRKLPLWKVESEVLGANHAEAGAYLLALWGLPYAIVEAVAHHHLPANQLGNKFSAVTAVHMANGLVKSEHPGKSGFPEVEIDLAYAEDLGLGGKMDLLREIVGGSGAPSSENTSLAFRRDIQAAALAQDETTEITETTPENQPGADQRNGRRGSYWVLKALGTGLLRLNPKRQ